MTRSLALIVALMIQVVTVEVGVLFSSFFFEDRLPKVLHESSLLQKFVSELFLAVVILTGLRNYFEKRSEDTYGLAITLAFLSFGRSGVYPSWIEFAQGKVSLDSLFSYMGMAFAGGILAVLLVVLVDIYLKDNTIGKVLAESLGTFFLFTIATGAVDAYIPGAPPFALAALILTYGAISQAHFNFAVSLAHLLLGRLKPVTFMLYVKGQLLGAFVGFIVGLAVNFPEFGEFTYLTATEYSRILVFELIGTAVLTFTVISAGTGPRGLENLAAVAIGFALYVGAVVLGQQVNPTFTVFLVTRALFEQLSALVLFEYGIRLVGQVAGSCLAAALMFSLDYLHLAGKDEQEQDQEDQDDIEARQSGYTRFPLISPLSKRT